ncbi:MAG: hypothetical protein ABI867_24445 [Kofleriaceae bacterium]
MFAIYRRLRGKSLGDQGYGAEEDPGVGIGDDRGLVWSQLKGKERDLVEFSALTGHCQCDLCSKYRTRAAMSYKVAEVIAPVRRAWELLETGGDAAALEAESVPKVREWDWKDAAGPSELAVLHDWLSEREVVLPPHLLGGIVANRARQR